MKSLLFVDHVFHRKTRSFDFLVEILAHEFNIEHIFIDPELPVDFDSLETSAEYVLVAQLDFLTPWFIKQNKKIICVQMFDGSAGLPDKHWLLNKQARYLNFSQTLHAKTCSLGCSSLLVKYAPGVRSEGPPKDFDTLRCFFWNRLPNSEINAKSVADLLQGQLDHCHIHLPRDDSLPSDEDVSAYFDCPVSTSNWLKSKREFDDILASCNVFVAPRVAEGIGHSFLDAMASGMLVIAWDLPTHNEYISNWHNGILFNQGVQHIAIRGRSDLQQISQDASRSIALDHQKWQTQKQDVVKYVLECPAAEAPTMVRTSRDVQSIIRSYQLGVESYRKALDRHALTVSLMGDWRGYNSETETSDSDPRTETTRLDLLFGQGNARYLKNRGFSTHEECFTWTSDTSARIEIPCQLLPRGGKCTEITIKSRSIRRNPVSIKIDGELIAQFTATPDWNEAKFSVDLGRYSGRSCITLDIDSEFTFKPKNGDKRNLGISIDTISLVASNKDLLPAIRFSNGISQWTMISNSLRSRLDRLAELIGR